VLGRKNLLTYSWPGNVRELAHELERAIVFEEGDELDFQALGKRAQVMVPGDGAKAGGLDWFNEKYIFPPEGFSLEEGIMRLIQHALKQTNQNVSAAARLLGVSRDYLRYRLSGKSEEASMGKDGEQNAPESGN